jgi:hypothetical protein
VSMKSNRSNAMNPLLKELPLRVCTLICKIDF